MHLIFGSGGNDSIALFQWSIENGLTDLNVAYSDTGWAADFWNDRLNLFKCFIEKNGAAFHVIKSEGMINLVKRKKAWPCNGMAFCSYELKIKPAMAWMDSFDPEKNAICLVGIRREESPKRSNWPEWVEESENHGGRSLHSPLVRMTEKERNDLILRAGFDVLPHRSMECYPCVNANKEDIKLLTKERVDFIESVEIEMGFTKNNKARTMFRSGGGYKVLPDGKIKKLPKKHGGAKGIREVWQWSQTSNFVPGQADIFCDSGYCGS